MMIEVANDSPHRLTKGWYIMRFALLAYHNEAAFAKLSAPEREAEGQKFGAFIKELEQRGVREVNAALQPSRNATIVRAPDGNPVTGAGPYADTKEQLGGIYILNCKDLDEAIELAGKLPVARMGVVEVRPLREA
jgi:hypothetical protein